MVDEGMQRGGEGAAKSSFWESFDRELAEINAALERLQKETPAVPAQPGNQTAPAERVRRKRPKARRGKQATPAPAPEAEALGDTANVAADRPKTESTPASEPVQTASAAPPLPTGTDLSDARNFGVMPPTANLEPGTASPEDYRKRLAQDLAFANKVLHTSGVTAAVWREWRAFFKAAQERLRALTPGRGDEVEE